MDLLNPGALIGIGFGIVLSIIKVLIEAKRDNEATKELREAEKFAFLSPVNTKDHDNQPFVITPNESGDADDKKADEKKIAAVEDIDITSLGRLFNLYSKQIEKYQHETRSRATWSFGLALIAMFAGFGFLIWGGTVLLTAKETIVLASGGLISTVGGAISGYVAKTFLDVHKLSLTQLNRYFQQPVINDHILMAQRLAEESNDPETRKAGYEKIIDSLTKLIDAKTAPK